MDNVKFTVPAEIYVVNFGDNDGSVQCGIRPAVIVSNPRDAAASPVVLVCPLTSQKKKTRPTHVIISNEKYPELNASESTVLCEQITLISKTNLGRRITTLSPDDFYRVMMATKESLAF